MHQLIYVNYSILYNYSQINMSVCLSICLSVNVIIQSYVDRLKAICVLNDQLIYDEGFPDVSC